MPKRTGVRKWEKWLQGNCNNARTYHQGEREVCLSVVPDIDNDDDDDTFADDTQHRRLWRETVIYLRTLVLFISCCCRHVTRQSSPRQHAHTHTNTYTRASQTTATSAKIFPESKHHANLVQEKKRRKRWNSRRSNGFSRLEFKDFSSQNLLSVHACCFANGLYTPPEVSCDIEREKIYISSFGIHFA